MKREYPPLLDAGIHEIGVGDLDSVFVDPFRPSEHRQRLITRFRALLQRVESWGVPVEVWIDGSFATEKPDPEDIDVLFIFDRESGNQASPEVQRDLAAVFGEHGRRETRIRYGCDVYSITEDDAPMWSYWRGWFGFTRDERPKGIPCIKVGL